MRTVNVKTAGRKGSGFRAIACLLLLAFTLQSFITQTHIHGIFDPAGDSQIVKAQVNAPSHNGKAPADNPADCPLCQAIAHAGVFFTPSAPALILPISWAEMLAPVVLAGAIDRFSSHPWHSRAPPRL